MVIYIVKKNDTLFSISEMYSKDPYEIAALNGIDPEFSLVVGQSIVIPTSKDIIGTLSTNGYAYEFIDRELLEKTLPNLTYLSIFSYGFDENGSLISPNDEDIINLALSYGTAPVMVLTTLGENGTFSNELSSTLFSDIGLQEILIENIMENMRSKNYYALDIDFEFIYPEEEYLYIEFLKRIKSVLSENGFKLFISLPPKYSADQKGLLYEAYNYKELGEISDLSLLMTYEWGYTYGPPMAVSPLDQVKKVVDYAETEIPSTKMTMGVPNYAYDWKLPFVRGESKAQSIGNVDAVRLASMYNTEILYDNAAQTPYFYYTDKEGIQHVVWFEDARSIYAKLLFANQRNMQGIGIWNIMRDFPQMWLVIKENFNIRKY